MNSSRTVFETIADLYNTRGGSEYFGEPVSQAEHALQTARLARLEKAPNHLIAAALLHDIGHLLHGLGEDIALTGIDAGHERAGEAWLRERFGPDVSEPVRLHVAAKRWLAAVDPPYLDRLSPESTRSLALQGGPMSPDEIAAFEANPHFDDAVQLRRWDDLAKTPGLETDTIESYKDVLKSIAI